MNPYREFYEENKNKLFNYLMRMTGDHDLSKDLMQESFTRYLEHYGGRNLSLALLYTIARNALLDNLRSRGRTTPHNEDEEAQANNDQEKMLLVRDEYRRVLSAMGRLEETERDTLSLVISSNLSYKEIASITGISEANVKVRVHRARVKLREILCEGGR